MGRAEEEENVWKRFGSAYSFCKVMQAVEMRGWLGMGSRVELSGLCVVLGDVGLY